MSAVNITIPSQYYTNPHYYNLDKDRIFYRTWQFACHATDLTEPGSYKVVRIVEESVLVVRGRDGEIRAFYNVCQHRAHRLVEEDGQCDRLVCPYHAWTYRLDGTLSGAPGAGDVEGFDPRSIKLKPVRIEDFCGFIFVNLDPEADSLDTLYPGLKEEILSMKPGLPSMAHLHENSIVHDSNWKVSVENYSECYHCKVVHKYITSTVYSGTDYRISVENNIVRHHSPRHTERDLHGDLHIWTLWPNTAIQLYPMYRSLNIRQFQCFGPRETVYKYIWYVDPDLAPNAREEVLKLARAYEVTNGTEDQDIVRNVQLGLESRGYDRGPLIVTPTPTAESEIAVAHFQKQYLAAIGEPTA